MSGITIKIKPQECYDVQIAITELKCDREIISVAKLAEHIGHNQYRVRYIVDYLVEHNYVIRTPKKLVGAYKRYYMHNTRMIDLKEEIVQ